MKVLDLFKIWDKANSLKTYNTVTPVYYINTHIHLDVIYKYWKLKPLSVIIICEILEEQKQLPFLTYKEHTLEQWQPDFKINVSQVTLEHTSQWF